MSEPTIDGSTNRDTDARWSDPALLRSDQYADRENLDARSSIYDYRQPPQDFIPWALSHLPKPPPAPAPASVAPAKPPKGASGAGDGPADDAVADGPTTPAAEPAPLAPRRLLDLGCGPGRYLEHLSPRVNGVTSVAYGVDNSPGMAAHAAAFAPSIAANAMALPFPADTFDVVLAMHMLYHVPDPVDAAMEIRRVLKPNGVLLASTNGPRHLTGLRELMERATGGGSWNGSHNRFGTDNGAGILRAAFPQVTLYETEAELVVPDAEPVLAYFASIESFVAGQLNIEWNDAMAKLEPIVRDEIAGAGSVRTSTHAGVFVATARPGGKIADDVGIKIDATNLDAILAGLPRA